MDEHIKDVAEEPVPAAPAPKPTKKKRAKRGAPTGPRTGSKRPASEEKQRRIVRNFPAGTFEEALEFAKSIFAVGSGKPVRRLTLFNELGKSPESSASRQVITNSGKYGLVKGSYKADQLVLTPDGVRAIDDEGSSRERAKARVKLAIQDVELFKALYERFVGNKLPARAVLVDAAKELAYPQTPSKKRSIRSS